MQALSSARSNSKREYTGFDQEVDPNNRHELARRSRTNEYLTLISRFDHDMKNTGTGADGKVNIALRELAELSTEEKPSAEKLTFIESALRGAKTQIRRLSLLIKDFAGILKRGNEEVVGQEMQLETIAKEIEDTHKDGCLVEGIDLDINYEYSARKQKFNIDIGINLQYSKKNHLVDAICSYFVGDKVKRAGE